jgi:ATP-dependent Zn protease
VNTPGVVAHHEAGHAVAAWWFDHAIDFVTIEPGSDFAGRCLSSPEAFRPDGELDPQQYMKVLEDIVVCLAGHEAETVFTGRQNWVGSRLDRTIAVDLATYLCGPAEEVSALLNWRRISARAFVLAHGAEIEAVARTLLERTTLTGAEVREAIRLDIFAREPRLAAGAAAASMAVLRSED